VNSAILTLTSKQYCDRLQHLMQLQPQSIGPRVLPGPSLTVAAIYLAVSACATAPELDVMIHETPKGAVYLERIPDRSFQAAHPIRLDQAVVARVLRGVIVRDEKTVLDSTFSKDFKTVRAFSEEEDRKSTRLNSSHVSISYAVFCLKKKINQKHISTTSTSMEDLAIFYSD